MQRPTDLLDCIVGMKTRQPMTITLSDGRMFQGIVNGIQAEDGSGHSWLIQLATRDHSGPITVHVHLRD